MADAVDSKSTDGNIVGVQVPSRALCDMQKTLEIQRFQGSFFADFLVFPPLGENLGKIVAKKDAQLLVQRALNFVH